MKKLGFTLAEVLITLVIIGVIAAMTVPTLMNNTNAQEFRSALKKAISGVNQALTLHYALEGLGAQDYTSENGHDIVADLFKKRMNVIDGTYSSGYEIQTVSGGTGGCKPDATTGATVCALLSEATLKGYGFSYKYECGSGNNGCFQTQGKR